MRAPATANTSCTPGHRHDRAALELTGVSKSFLRGRERIVALDSVDLRVERGEIVAIVGRSGSGKSTLLYLAGGFSAPDQGQVEVAGHLLGPSSPAQLAKLRRTEIGFVFQFFHLIPTLSVHDNVALPLVMNREKRVDSRVASILDRVGLAGRASHRPTELSGGEMQRTAIARALIIDPSVIIADEPTGNLDSATSEQVLDLLCETATHSRAGLLLVTHSREVSCRADRTLTLLDGTLSPQHLEPVVP